MVTRVTTIRPDLAALPAYVPGRVVPGAIKLASNEVPLPPTPPVLAAIAEAAAAGNRYPDLAVVGLTARLAQSLGVDADRITELADNPTLEADGERGSAFDLTEGLDAEPAATLLAGAKPAA